jgi:hypothetical protein
MKEKSGGLTDKLGCMKASFDEGECLAGDKMIILCRKRPQTRTSRLRTGADQIFETIARSNAIAKLEVGYTSTRK